jgi:hypothetical protein
MEGRLRAATGNHRTIPSTGRQPFTVATGVEDNMTIMIGTTESVGLDLRASETAAEIPRLFLHERAAMSVPPRPRHDLQQPPDRKTDRANDSMACWNHYRVVSDVQGLRPICDQNHLTRERFSTEDRRIRMEIEPLAAPVDQQSRGSARQASQHHRVMAGVQSDHRVRPRELGDDVNVQLAQLGSAGVFGLP